MRLRHVTLAIAGLAVAAIGYFLGRSQTPLPQVQASGSQAREVPHHGAVVAAQDGRTRHAPRADGLPARGVPLRRVLSVLQARANAGDLDAARRLYSDLGACSRLAGMERMFAGIADDVLAGAPDPADARSVEAYGIQLDGIDSRKRNLQRFHELCDGIDRDALDLQVPALRQAALLGDEHARACYLDRGPTYDAAGLTRHPEWLQRYRSSVASLIDAGIADGDWKVVDVLGSAYQPGADSPLAGFVGVDPVMYYRYRTLFRLGAEPDRVAPIDRQLAAAAARLTPEQRMDADVWAQSTVQQRFGQGSSTTATVPGWDPCAFTFDPW